jgi:hypothetical protein
MRLRKLAIKIWELMQPFLLFALIMALLVVLLYVCTVNDY